ncbi:hypothetical protein UFOVP330_74 [uncultured Caudovirales phage]|uniref:Uncharacterized protein n=1 Tax=uncultured Caudovirales phage TaxID=2100421 RepID=A0A6J5LWL4_9CAUD|nr:hypothetical protein UFOVP330_74 [uncultured Caudovirales phage]
MAKRTRKMGNGGMSSSDSSSEMNDEEDGEESSPKRRVKKVTVVENFAKGGMVPSNGCVMAGRGGKYKGMK